MKWLEEMMYRAFNRALLFGQQFQYERLTSDTQRHLFYSQYKIQAQRREIDNLHNQLGIAAEQHNRTKVRMADYYRALEAILVDSTCTFSKVTAHDMMEKHRKKK